MGEEFARIMTWPFDDLLMPEEDTGPGGADVAMAQPTQVTPDADPVTGAVAGVKSIEEQAAQRRLARMSRYFTTPSGVLDSNTGSAGVF